MSVTKEQQSCWVLTTVVDKVQAKGKMTVYAAFGGYVGTHQVCVVACVDCCRALLLFLFRALVARVSLSLSFSSLPPRALFSGQAAAALSFYLLR